MPRDAEADASAGSDAMNLCDLEQVAATRFRWQPPAYVFTPSGTVQGGAGLGAACAAMEAVTGRPTIWSTAQYLSFASGADPLFLDVTVEVSGHNTSQARCELTIEGREVLTAHSALGARDDSAISGVWCTRPPVPAPRDCPDYGFFERTRGGFGGVVEHRLALGRQLSDIEADPGRPGDGRSAFWIRMGRGSRPMDVGLLAFIGDFMPLGFANALGLPYAGNSLDNTMRVGTLVDTEWVLLSVHVQQAVRGFGYGGAELWAEDGTLLGAVSQSVILRSFARIHSRVAP